MFKYRIVTEYGGGYRLQYQSDDDYWESTVDGAFLTLFFAKRALNKRLANQQRRLDRQQFVPTVVYGPYP